MRIRYFFIASLLLLLSFSAHALNRIIPATAKRGVISFVYYPTVLLDGKLCRTSAGLRIWNRNNLTQVRGAFAGTKFEAKYTVDTMGQIDRIWVLTVQEILLSPRIDAFADSEEEDDTNTNTEDDSDTDSDTDDSTDEE